MILNPRNSHDAYLKQAFSWLTRIGVAPKFGTVPLGYYQKRQCDALEFLEKAIGPFEVRCKKGMIQFKAIGQWGNIMTAKVLANLTR